MTRTERRQFPRHDIEFAVTIHKDKEKIPATMIDISEGGIGIISGRRFYPDTKVNISLNYINDYAIHGTVKWATLVTQNDNPHYQIGIEVDLILIELGTDTIETADRSEFVNRLISDTFK